jgi:hypothetical protein
MSRPSSIKSEAVLLAAALAFLALLPITKLADFDAFFHLRLGRYVWETLDLYRTDTFTHTSFGMPQNTSEWLSNLVMYAAYRVGGYLGLGLLKSALFLLTCLFLFRSSLARTGDRRDGADVLAAVLALVAFAFAIRFRLDLRPYYATYVFLAAYLFVLYRHRLRGGRYILALPLMQVVWANTHGAHVLGPALIAIFVASEALRTRRFPALPALVLVLSTACALASPSGIAGAGGLGALGGEGARRLGEWQPMTRDLLWGFGIRYTFGYQMLVAGAFAGLFLRAMRREFDLMDIALFIAAVVFPMRAVRLVAPAAVLLTPLCALFLAEALAKILGARARAAAPSLGAAAGIAVLIGTSVLGSSHYTWGIGPKPGTFPDAAIAFLDEHGIGGNAFTTVTAGSYMLWAAPERKTFIDGRLVVTPEADRAYDAAIRSERGMEGLVERYGISYALLDYNPKAQWRFPVHLGGSPHWALLWWDRTAALFVRRSAVPGDLVERYAYRVLRPAFEDLSYLDPFLRLGPRGLLPLIDRDIALNPDNQEAYMARAYAAYYFGMQSEALAALDAAIALPPDTAFEHASRAQLLFTMGRGGEARAEVGLALAIDPRHPTARTLAGRPLPPPSH